MTIYTTRCQARKAALGGEIIVKVDGGYTIMAARQYQVWRRQK